MTSAAATPQEYYDTIPEGRKAAMQQLRDVINANLPEGFMEVMNYGMPGWVVPHSLYPAGYHCDPKLPLPFISIASQKNFIALYAMGLYADSAINEWFVAEYPKFVKTKPDMGKGCVRFKKPESIPLALIGELAAKITPQQWIEKYELSLKKR